jgi:hypothetical protein
LFKFEQDKLGTPKNLNMKNHFLRTAFFLPLFFLSFFSCEESQFSPKQSFEIGDGVTIDEGILSFVDIKAFRNLIDNKGTREKEQLMKLLSKQVGYVSLGEYVAKLSHYSPKARTISEDEYSIVETNEFLSSILNEDALIGIGDFIFRIDFQNEIVYALPKSLTSQIDEFMSTNPANGNLLKFSTSDDVLSIIESGDYKDFKSGRTAFLCFREGGAGARDSKYQATEVVEKANAPSLVMNADMKHVYQKAGIYFSLMLELKYMYKKADCSSLQCYSSLATDISANVTYRYKRKCTGNDTGNITTTFYAWGDNKLSKRLWESTNALRLFYLDTKFFWTHKGYDPNLLGPAEDDNVEYFLIKQGSREYHLTAIYDNL